MPSFDLIDEPWIPCLMMRDGRLEYLGLGETLRQAASIREVSDQSPLVTAAVHRLLLAILHRNFGPEEEAAWKRLWDAEKWPMAEIDAYFGRWRARFDLFDGEHPFYQVASLRAESAVPVAKIAHELASGNNDTLFDHTTDDAGFAFEPGLAARRLLSWLAFAPGGLQSTDGGQGRDASRSADGAPLVKGAIALARGENLFQTLLLNMHCYSPVREQPFKQHSDVGVDRPAWEREEETKAEDRLPDGYLDLLTWQSRRIRLLPELDDDGHAIVRRVVLLKGNQFPDGYSSYGRETMLAFKKALRASPGQEPWPAIGFSEDRAIWRDSLALFESAAEQHERAKTLGWLAELCYADLLPWTATLRLDLLGLCSDRAKVFFWRHERLPVPLAYLGDKDLVDSLRLALRLAEGVAKELASSDWLVAKLIVAPGSDEPGARQPKNDVVRPLATSLATGRRFWSRLEVAFKQLLVTLPAERTEDDGVVAYGSVTALPDWERRLRESAMRSFAETVNGLETSPRTLRAAAKAERTLRIGLRTVLRSFSNIDS